MPIITISRQLGSLGSEIARQLSETLHCRFLDKQLLEEAFSEYGISRESIERFDERKPAFWELFKADKDRYLHFMKGAIYDFARQGSCIILGRGGQILLGGLPGVLHVRVFAPESVRRNRIEKRYECDEHHAEKIIRHNDRERAGYLKFFFEQDWEDINLYDLLINTGSLTASMAVRMISEVVETEEFEKDWLEATQKLTDLSLEHEARTRIIYKERIVVQFLEINVENQVMTLRGIVDDESDVELCRNLVVDIPGIKEVRNEIYYSPITTSYGLHY